MPESLWRGLQPQCRLVSVTEGDAFFRPGDAPAVYALLRGRAAIRARPAPAIEVDLFLRHPGQLFGEVSLLLGQHANEARALVAATAGRIDAAALRAVLAKSQPTTLALARLIAERMAVAETRLGEVAPRGVKHRLLRALQRLAAEAEMHDSRGWLLPEVTQEELGRLVGASRVAVNHALGALRTENCIAMAGRRIIVRRLQ